MSFFKLSIFNDSGEEKSLSMVSKKQQERVINRQYMLCSTENTKIGTLNKKRKQNRKSFANRTFFHCFNVFSNIWIQGSHL